MTLIAGILEEEQERLESLLKQREERLSAYPRGSVRIKKIGEREYLYRVYRERSKIISEYLCSRTSPKAKHYLKENSARLELKKSIKEIRTDISDIGKSLEKLRRKWISKHFTNSARCRSFKPIDPCRELVSACLSASVWFRWNSGLTDNRPGFFDWSSTKELTLNRCSHNSWKPRIFCHFWCVIKLEKIRARWFGNRISCRKKSFNIHDYIRSKSSVNGTDA